MLCRKSHGAVGNVFIYNEVFPTASWDKLFLSQLLKNYRKERRFAGAENG
jgi:hypothetical protein